MPMESVNAAIYFLIIIIILIFIVLRLRNYKLAKPLLGISSAVFLLLILTFIMESVGYEFPLYILSASISITCMGTVAASVIRTKWSKENEPEDKFISAVSSIAFIVIGAVSACGIAYWIVERMDLQVTFSQLFFLILIGSVTGALLESIPSGTDKNFNLIMGTGMIMWLFAIFGYYVNFYHLSMAFIFSLILAYLAYRLNVADVSAMHSATLLGVLIILFTNINWYLVLITFFLLGGGFTRYRYNYKLKKGIAQSKHGVRSYVNVLSNSTAALVVAVCYGVYHGFYPQLCLILPFAYLGAVATATGDTLASEIGVTAKSKPVMITTLKPVDPGIDGGISLLGELACISGSLIIGILGLVLGVIGTDVYSPVYYIVWIMIVVLGGVLGTNFDSLLGATLQQKGILSNNGVNFISTFVGAFISGTAYYVLSNVMGM